MWGDEQVACDLATFYSYFSNWKMVLQECWSCSCESTGENLKTGYLTPYLESFEPDFRNGVNFAAGGSSTLPRNVPFNLNVQVLQFIRFHNQSLESHSKGNMPTSWRWSSTLRFLSLLLTCFDIKKKKKNIAQVPRMWLGTRISEKLFTQSTLDKTICGLHSAPFHMLKLLNRSLLSSLN